MRTNIWLPVALVGCSLTLPMDAAAADCTSVTLNSSCTLTVEREQPVGPLPVRVSSESSVTLEVRRRPLEDIVLDVALTDTVPADPLNAIFSALLTPIRAFKTNVMPEEATGFTPGARDLDVMLASIDADQQAARARLVEYQLAVRKAAEALRTVQRTRASEWIPEDLTTFVKGFVCYVTGPPARGDTGCEDTSLAGMTLPSAEVLDERIDLAITR